MKGLKRAILGMALTRENDGSLFNGGFVREGIAEHGQTYIDELVSEGYIEPITIFVRTEKGEKLWSESEKESWREPRGEKE